MRSVRFALPSVDGSVLLGFGLNIAEVILECWPDSVTSELNVEITCVFTVWSQIHLLPQYLHLQLDCRLSGRMLDSKS